MKNLRCCEFCHEPTTNHSQIPPQGVEPHMGVLEEPWLVAALVLSAGRNLRTGNVLGPPPPFARPRHPQRRLNAMTHVLVCFAGGAQWRPNVEVIKHVGGHSRCPVRGRNTHIGERGPDHHARLRTAYDTTRSVCPTGPCSLLRLPYTGMARTLVGPMPAAWYMIGHIWVHAGRTESRPPKDATIHGEAETWHPPYTPLRASSVGAGHMPRKRSGGASVCSPEM